MRHSTRAARGADRASREDVRRLLRRLEALEERARRQPQEPEELHALLVAGRERPLLRGHATREATERLVSTLAGKSVTFYRPMQDVLGSTLGIGTGNGGQDQETDLKYVRAIGAALRGGINLIDTSLNYRHQRSELAVGAALREFTLDRGARDGIVVCSKAGYLVPGAFAPAVLTADAVAGGKHSMALAFLMDQIRRSRRNLGLETIDVYYLHNPEFQLRFVDRAKFMNRIRGAFEAMERAASDGLVRYYGTATWDGYRSGALSLSALGEEARRIAGDNHHFRFLQLPFNLQMQEARTRRGDDGATVLGLAADLGITVIASASLAQGRLLQHRPMRGSAAARALRTDAQRAIQFVRSTPGISSALVGMRDVAHVTENLVVSRIPPGRAFTMSKSEEERRADGAARGDRHAE